MLSQLFMYTIQIYVYKFLFFFFVMKNKILLCNSKLCIITKQFFYSTNFAYRKLYKIPITYAGRHKLCTQGSKFVNTFYHTYLLTHNNFYVDKLMYTIFLFLFVIKMKILLYNSKLCIQDIFYAP